MSVVAALQHLMHNVFEVLQIHVNLKTFSLYIMLQSFGFTLVSDSFVTHEQKEQIRFAGMNRRLKNDHFESAENFKT